jgi:hypothetical protein
MSGKIKPPCETCKKPKEVLMEKELFTKEEFDKVMPLLDKFGITHGEMNYIYNFYNRVFGTNKQPGCGKCFVNNAKNLKARYRELYG